MTKFYIYFIFSLLITTMKISEQKERDEQAFAKYGLSIDDDDPLQTMCREGNIEGVKYLQSAGFSITSYHTGLVVAFEHMELLDYLFEINAPFDTRAMDLACYKGNGVIIFFLHQKLGLKYTKDALKWACHAGQLFSVKYLLEKMGAHFDSYHVDIACSKGYREVVMYLHENGIKWTNRGLKWAIENGHEKLAEDLIELME